MNKTHHGISGSSIEFLGKIVRKKAKPGGERKLIAQAEHLRALHKLLGENCIYPIEIEEDAYTMEYYPGVSLDVYCTMCSQQVAFYRLQEIIHILWEKLYAKHKKLFDMRAYLGYIKKRTQDYGKLGPDISTLSQLLDELEPYLNGKSVLEQCPAGLVHGDLTFENIIVTADSFVLIDSNPPPGGIAPWTLDVGKLKQSLFSLYEMTKYSGVKSQNGLKSIYTHLADRFARLFPKWDESMDIQSQFFELSHYTRLLDYQFKIDPKISEDYYRRSIHLLKHILESMRLINK